VAIGRPRRWRWRVLAAVVPTGVVLLGATTLLPTGPRTPDAYPVPLASETQCLPTGSLDTVADLDTFATQVRGDPEFAGGDVGASTALQDGRQLFVFGDTLRGADFAGQQVVRNSMLVFDGRCAQVVLPADHGALVPDRADGVGYWPMSVSRVERPGYDLVGVATQRVRTKPQADPADVFAFDNLGPAVALFVVPAGGTPQLISTTDLGPDSPDPERPEWGAATAVTKGWIYTYGTSRRAQPALGEAFSLRVARVRPEDLLDQSRWHYWDGTRWSERSDTAAVLIPGQDGVSQTLSVFRQDGTWYAISKRGDFLGSDLTVWTSPSPHGPFTAASAPARIPSDAATGTLRYMPLAHPDLLPQRGSVVVSYSQNNTDIDVVRDDPRSYRPRFLRIPLPR